MIVLLLCALVHAQEEVPINIRVQQVFVETGTRYQFYLPEGEFHGRLHKPFPHFSVTAEMDYELFRGDIGFGAGYILSSPSWKPGIFFRDQLLFRPLNEDTREWSRKKSFTVSAIRDIGGGGQVRVSLQYERQRSPYKENLIKVLSYRNYAFCLGLYVDRQRWGMKATLEKALRWFGGDFSYLLLEARVWREFSTRWGLRYRVEGGWAGNILGGPSPRYYLGGWSSVVGYEDDEFFGPKRLFLRSWLSQVIFRRGGHVGWVKFSGWRGIVGLDLGSVGPMTDIGGYKFGTGVGIGFDIGYKARTVPVAFIMAYPLKRRGTFRVHLKLGR